MRMITEDIKFKKIGDGTEKNSIKIEITFLTEIETNGILKLEGLKKKGKRLLLDVRKYRKERSLDANAYCWILCQKLAEVIGGTKEDVYKRIIRDIGQFDIVLIKDKAAKRYIEIWNDRGLGWYAEEIDCSVEDCKKIIAYYGSSCYDTWSMSILIDFIVQECKEQDIETKTPKEILELKKKWGR